MAKAPKVSPFSSDYMVDRKRIWETPREIVLWPNWETYESYRKRYEKNPSSQVWQAMYSFSGQPFAVPLHKEGFDNWREGMIQDLVEGPCQPLVRRILDAGHFTLYSNAYGGGDKGVEFTRDLYKYHATRTGRLFCFLENWDTSPQIVSADGIISSG